MQCVILYFEPIEPTVNASLVHRNILMLLLDQMVRENRHWFLPLFLAWVVIQKYLLVLVPSEIMLKMVVNQLQCPLKSTTMMMRLTSRQQPSSERLILPANHNLVSTIRMFRRRNF